MNKQNRSGEPVLENRLTQKSQCNRPTKFDKITGLGPSPNGKTTTKIDETRGKANTRNPQLFQEQSCMNVCEVVVNDCPKKSRLSRSIRCLSNILLVVLFVGLVTTSYMLSTVQHDLDDTKTKVAGHEEIESMNAKIYAALDQSKKAFQEIEEIKSRNTHIKTEMFEIKQKSNKSEEKIVEISALMEESISSFQNQSDDKLSKLDQKFEIVMKDMRKESIKMRVITIIV